MNTPDLPQDASGPPRMSRGILVFRSLILVLAVVVLIVLSLRMLPGLSSLVPVGIIFLLIFLQTLFPLKYFLRESNLAHLTALGAGLLVGPIPAGWAVLLGSLVGWSARRGLRGNTRPGWMEPSLSFLETMSPGSAAMLSLGLSALLLNDSAGGIPEGFGWDAALFTLGFTIILSTLVIAEIWILSRTGPPGGYSGLRSAVIQLFLWYIIPAPFILLIASLDQSGWLGPLILVGVIPLTLSVLLFRIDRLAVGMDQRTRQMSTLNQYSVQASTSLEEANVLDWLCESAVSLSGAAGSAVYLHHLEDGTVRLEAAHRLSEQFIAENQYFPFSLSARVQSLIMSRPLTVPDVTLRKPSRDYYELLQKEGIRAYGDFPLISQDGPIGFLSVYYTNPHPFKPQELELFETITALAAVSVSAARLHGRTDLALSRRIHQLSILETVSRELAVAIQSERLFDLVLDYAVDFTDASWGSVSLLSYSAQQMTVKASRGYASFPALIRVKGGLPGKAARLQQVVNSTDVLSEHEYVDYTGGLARSHLSVPLLHTAGVLGVISLESARPEAFTSADEMFLQQLASQAAVALELYQSIQTRELITETLVHDIRSPISAALGALEVIEDALPESIGEKGKIIRQATQVSRQAAYRVLRLIESLLDIARFQSGKIDIYQEPVALRAFLFEILDGFAAQAAEYNVQLCNDVPAEIPDLYVDRGKINRVLSNLVDNALKFSPSGSQIIATASSYEGGKVIIQVMDSGPGIPEEFRERIFERFSQIPGTHARRRGTGLGLTFCRLAVEAHGGRIWVESSPSGGSAFNLTLPCWTSSSL